jgi:hypothetical protein
MIKTKIEITTPPGKEEIVLFIFKHVFLKVTGIWRAETYTAPEGGLIYIETDLSAKQYAHLIRNEGMISSLFKQFWQSKFCQHIIKDKPANEVEDIRIAICENTKVRTIMTAEATKLLSEYFENQQLTFWERIKKKFKKENKIV